MRSVILSSTGLMLIIETEAELQVDGKDIGVTGQVGNKKIET